MSDVRARQHVNQPLQLNFDPPRIMLHMYLGPRPSPPPSQNTKTSYLEVLEALVGVLRHFRIQAAVSDAKRNERFITASETKRLQLTPFYGGCL